MVSRVEFECEDSLGSVSHCTGEEERKKYLLVGGSEVKSVRQVNATGRDWPQKSLQIFPTVAFAKVLTLHRKKAG